MSEIKEVINYDLSDKFQLEDLADRKLYINSDIDETTVDDVGYNILRFNAVDKDIPINKRKPILLYISSAGGSVNDGMGLVDIIMNSKTPVYTINFSYQYSMAFMVGIVGHKRFASKSASYLIHDGSIFLVESGNKGNDTMMFYNKQTELIKKLIVSKSKITEEEYMSKQRTEWYLMASEAKEKGIVDYIIGEDCDIDMVV